MFTKRRQPQNYHRLQEMRRWALPPRETHNVPRRTNDRGTGKYVADLERRNTLSPDELLNGHTGPVTEVA